MISIAIVVPKSTHSTVRVSERTFKRNTVTMQQSVVFRNWLSLTEIVQELAARFTLNIIYFELAQKFLVNPYKPAQTCMVWHGLWKKHHVPPEPSDIRRGFINMLYDIFPGETVRLPFAWIFPCPVCACFFFFFLLANSRVDLRSNRWGEGFKITISVSFLCRFMILF